MWLIGARRRSAPRLGRFNQCVLIFRTVSPSISEQLRYTYSGVLLMISKIIITINSLALMGALVWLYKSRDYEPAITTLSLISTLIVLFFRKKDHSETPSRPAHPSTEEQPKRPSHNYTIIVAVIACSLLAFLWWSREHIEPLKGPIRSPKQGKIQISSPYPGENVRIGYLKVLWSPQAPKILEFYRKNVSIEKTSFPVLSGTRIYLNQPGEVVIKIWTSNSSIEDQRMIIVVGASSFRTILILIDMVLFIVTGWLVLRGSSGQPSHIFNSRKKGEK